MEAWLDFPDSELDHSGHEHNTTHRNVAATRRATATSRRPVTEQGRNTSVEKTASKCPICRRTFSIRKTMLRHVRTVHASKDLDCPSCDRKFIRQDNLNRHIAEQHTSNDHFITCTSCGRHVSKRGLPEHLQSKVCKASRTNLAAASSDEYEHLYAEDENDCFLLTIRVLKMWLSLAYDKENQGSEEQSSSSRSATPNFTSSRSATPNFTSSENYHRCISLGNRALDSLNAQMRDSVEPQSSLKLFCTAVLWACISLVGMHTAEHVSTGFRDYDAHLIGADALLKAFHSSTCDCDKFLRCAQLQKRAAKDPALALLKAIVRETGLVGILLRILPSVVRSWRGAVRLIDKLIQCLLNQIDQGDEEITGHPSMCEVHGIEVDPRQARGFEAMVWAIVRVRSNTEPRPSPG